jgi:RHS repeat-associated protein
LIATTTETNAASFAADKTVYEYNGPYGEVTKSTDAAGTTTTYTYDSHGNLTAQTVAAGTALAQETRYAYDAVGNRVSQTVMGTNGQPYAVTLMAYDSRGNVTQRVEAAGTACARVASYTYDNMGNVLTQADALGHTTVNRYDAAGRLLATVNPLGACTVSNVYNQAGTVETAWDAMGRRTDSLYDIKGHATNVTVSVGDVVLSRTVSSYDADGNLLSKTDDSGLTIRYAYDARGNPVKVVASDGRVWTAEYDAYGRLIRAVDPQTNATVVAYDPATGQKASVLDKGVLTLYTYNALAQLACARVVAGGQTNTVTMTYDALGNLLSRTDAEGRTQRMVLDTLGRVTGLADALMQTNRVAYGLSGQVESLTDANGNRTGWAYDVLGQLLAKTYDDGTRVTYTYDAAGRLASRLDAKGGYATYVYDALGNLVTNRFYVAANAASPARTVAYAYDALSRLVRCDDGVAVNTVVYDDAARTRTVTADYGDGQSMTSVYRYDPVAREMTCDFGGATNVYRYDADGKLLAVSVPGEGWATYSYNALGQNVAVTLPGGTVRALAYDAFGRLASQSAVDGGGNVLLAQAYGRSLTGRLVTKTTDAGTWKYGYDLTDQVTNAVLSASASDGAWGYAYDAMGNRKQSAVGSEQPDVTAYVANRLNQYSLISNHVNHVHPVQISPAYDLNGNMTWDGTNAYFWDLQNQLVLVSNAAVQVASAYDAMGRRVRKEVSVWDGQLTAYRSQSTVYFFYDGWNLVRETQHSLLPTFHSSTHLYIWGNDLSGTLQGAGGVGGLLTVSCVSSSTSYLSPLTYYPLYDHNGNVERYISRSGATAAAFQYDVFGNTVAETFTQSGNNAFTHFRFSTKYWDDETGLYYYGYRYYSTWLGRWASRDPIGEIGGHNLYKAVKNNSNIYIDVFGLDTGCCSDERIMIELIKKTKEAREEAGRKENSIEVDWNWDGRNGGTNKQRLYREFGGYVCCNKKTGDVTSVGPWPGTWKTEIDGVETLTDNPLLLARYGAGGTMANVLDDPNKKCPKGYDTAGFYHAHPPGSQNFSKGDRGWPYGPSGRGAPIALGSVGSPDILVGAPGIGTIFVEAR